MYIVKRGERLSLKNKKILLNDLIIVEGGGSIDAYNCLFESNGKGGIIIIGDYGNSDSSINHLLISDDFDDANFDKRYPKNYDNDFIDNNIIKNCEFVNFTENHVLNFYGLDENNIFDNISLIDCKYGIRINNGKFIMSNILVQIESENSNLLDIINFDGIFDKLKLINKNINNKGSFINAQDSNFIIKRMKILFDIEYESGDISSLINGVPILINNSIINLNGYDYDTSSSYLPHLIIRDGDSFVIDADIIYLIGFIIVEGGGKLICSSDNLTTIFSDDHYCGLIILGKPIDDNDIGYCNKFDDLIENSILPEFNREYSIQGSGNNVLKNISFMKGGIKDQISCVNFIGLGKDNIFEKFNVIDSEYHDLYLKDGNCHLEDIILSNANDSFLFIDDHIGSINDLMFDMSKDHSNYLIETKFTSKNNITNITNCSLSDNSINKPIKYGDLKKYHSNKINIFNIDPKNNILINNFNYSGFSCYLPHILIKKGEKVNYNNEVVILKGLLIVEYGAFFSAKNTCFISDENNYGGIVIIGKNPNKNILNNKQLDFIDIKYDNLEKGKIIIDNCMLIGLGNNNNNNDNNNYPSLLVNGSDINETIDRLIITKSKSLGIQLIKTNLKITKSIISECKKQFIDIQNDNSNIQFILKDTDEHNNTSLINFNHSFSELDLIYEKNNIQYIKDDISKYHNINNGYIFNITNSKILLNNIAVHISTNLLGINNNITKKIIDKQIIDKNAKILNNNKIKIGKHINIVMDESKEKFKKNAKKMIYPTIGNAMLKVAGKKLFSYETKKDVKKIYRNIKK